MSEDNYKSELNPEKSGWESGAFPEINFWKEGDPEIHTDDEKDVLDVQDDQDNVPLNADQQMVLTQEEAESLVDEAVEFYFSDDFRTAVHIFSQALEVLTQTYSQKDLGEIWYYYGDSLLMSAKERSTFLSEADFDDPDETIEDVEERAEKQEKEEKVEKQEKEEKIEKDDQEQDEKDIAISEELELAWQILELARIAFQDDEDKRKELSNVHLSLANVAVESDNIQGAIEEFDECIRIRSDLMGNHRQVAEVYYLKGVALSGIQEYIDLAKESFEKAVGIIAYNIEEMTKYGDTDGANELQEVYNSLQEHIQELSGETIDPELIREIVNSNMESGSAQIGFNPPSEGQKVVDLTGQIKRSGIKRKAGSPNDEDRVVKKSKNEEE